MGCIFSCGNEEDVEDGNVRIITTEPRRNQVQRQRSRSRNRRSSSHSLQRDVVTEENINTPTNIETPVHSNKENVSSPTNVNNLNSTLRDKNINLETSGIILIPEELPEEKTIDLAFRTEKAQMVINLFSKYSKNNKITLRIKHIKEVINPYLLGMYNLKKEEMLSRDRHVDELFLFHGTKRKNVRSICDDNLNWRLSGTAVGNRFGQGVSLSPKATYASHYSDKDMPVKVMFLMKVLFSKALIGTEDMVIPKETKNNQTVFYDTSMKEDCSVVVKYCDNEFYPAYIIYFEHV